MFRTMPMTSEELPVIFHSSFRKGARDMTNLFSGLPSAVRTCHGCASEVQGIHESIIADSQT